ncbi:MAG: 4'-phosphopantetheinyl transferase superfamily protein [Anaerolineales bacterium]|nr:4'-phosphopantetheinyl transferase superfamily protein [Anaerolineales bacterium]
MIHWLTQTAAAHPDLVLGLSPAGLLTAAEEARFVALHTDKRRRDWLLGRWTAKHLLQQVIAGKIGIPPSLQTITIHNQLNGAPVARYLHPEEETPSPIPDQFTLSISHAGEYAFCALVEQPDWPMGADIEQITPRAAAFVSDYFTPPEQELLRQSPPPFYDMMVTAMWSAKEATLKALQLGLTVDTRAVTCLIAPVHNYPRTWTPFTVELDEGLLVGRLPAHLAAKSNFHRGVLRTALTGWWQMIPGYVLTIVAAPQMGTNSAAVAQ